MSELLFDLPDGSQVSSLQITTTLENRFITGSLPISALGMEVSIRGQAFTGITELFLISGDSFTVPNPEYYPDGLPLQGGSNAISIRAILPTGYSVPISGIITRVDTVNINSEAPSGILVERRQGSVRVSISQLPTDLGTFQTNIRGYNFYASTESGGGATGYRKLNVRPVVDFVSSYTEDSVGDVVADSVLDRTGLDPSVVMRYIVQQERSNGTLISVDLDRVITLPDTILTLQSSITGFEVVETRQFSFDHTRNATASSSPSTIFNSVFANTNADTLLYYVATTIYYDSFSGVETESSFSAEAAGRPAEIAASLNPYPVVSRDVLRDQIVLGINRANPNVSVQAGSVIRDTFIDPLTSEVERTRFLIDFFYRASSFSTLLQIDDPSGSGTSQPVSQSSYKRALGQALFITNEQAIQNIIDRAFEKLATNFGVTRNAGASSRGLLTFYLTSPPQRTYTISIGIQIFAAGQSFRTTQSAQISFANSATYYDPVTKWYSVTVFVQANTPGSAGNLAKGQLRGTTSGLNYINNSKLFGGSDLESNRDLAVRAMNRLASVDTGTISGYRYAANSVPGVIQTRIVAAGDSLMLRDIDPLTGDHRGGKVDIWVQGRSDAIISETFAFTFQTAQDAQFIAIGDPTDLIFKAIDLTLSSTNPIVQMLDNVTLFLGLRNATTGDFFDLTGYSIISYNIIQLSNAVPQPPYSLTDVFLGDYRYRSANAYVLSQQPVQRIVSVTGETSGLLPASSYRLLRTEPFLLEGRSTQAKNSVVLDLTSSPLIPVVSEPHVMTGFDPEFLNKLGVNPYSIRVFDVTGAIEYTGSFSGTGLFDFVIIPGTSTLPTAVQRITGSTITSGQSVVIDYEYDQNFVVRYEINAVIESVQEKIDQTKHITADVLVKAAIPVPIDISATVVLEVGANRETVDSAIRRNITTFISQFRTDNPIRQSDVTAIIEETPGVSYVIQPLTKLSRAKDSYVVNDVIPTAQAGDSFLITAWSNPSNLTWLLRAELTSATTTGGGNPDEFRAVYRDTTALEIQPVLPNVLSPGYAYIIGSEGIVIPGYSDDATLIAEGYVNITMRNQRRVEITRNRVIVSLPVGVSPTKIKFSATYLVGVETGPKNINPGPTEFLTLGTVEFSYDEDRENSIRRLRQ